MYFLAGKAEKALEIGRVIGATNLVREFERNIMRELDMMIEAGSIEKFARNFEEVEEIYIPKVYWDYTTRSVLVMEHIEGMKMDQVEEIRAAGIDPKEVAMIGLRSFSRQLMLYGFFHADPHPGNTIVMYDGRVSLVDFGITGYLDEEMMRQIANLFLGYAEHDYDMVMDALMDAGLINEEMDLKAFRNDLKDVSESFYGRSLQHISVKDVYDQIDGSRAEIPHQASKKPAAASENIYPDRGAGKDTRQRREHPGSDQAFCQKTPAARLEHPEHAEKPRPGRPKAQRLHKEHSQTSQRHPEADRGGQAADRTAPHRLR